MNDVCRNGLPDGWDESPHILRMLIIILLKNYRQLFPDIDFEISSSSESSDTE